MMLGSDGTIRKTYYGDGEQPWDAMKRIGWAAQFAAANVLKYLRRTKEPQADREKAIWYYTELKKLAAEDTRDTRVLRDLLSEITANEHAVLVGEVT